MAPPKKCNCQTELNELKTDLQLEIDSLASDVANLRTQVNNWAAVTADLQTYHPSGSTP